ncbi:hypothetical protein E6C27_scaffold36G001430 [Cucumis melo var. makuwa]|uniref:Uncharacterized protein n=1 Tax=Cucumis melo var. makuwa TaxID=1194695 RepID=A0A5A7T8L0_CUCMM|nr:hypothetical protein E6C27_scaffold36G001430 [Cucumis melo var. makuwa]
MEIDENEKQSLLKVVKSEELFSDEEEFSSEKEENLLNALLEESSEEPSSSENETDNEEAIPCSGCINVLTSIQRGLLDIIEEVNDEAIRKKDTFETSRGLRDSRSKVQRSNEFQLSSCDKSIIKKTCCTG